MGYVIGVDGGGTRTTLVVANEDGGEVMRREGPPGLVDPRDPTVSAETIAMMIRAAMVEVEFDGPADTLCAGLAGAGNAAERETVRRALESTGLSRKVLIVSDGEIALEGALGREAGILLVSGTGSIAYGRGEDGSVLRCGGWGMVLGDEGSGYAIGRAALRAALCSVDGRGPETRLLDMVLAETGVSGPDGLPPWAGRAGKAEIARLTTPLVVLAESGDRVALGILERAANDLASHATALRERLRPWSRPSKVVLHGGVTRRELFSQLVSAELHQVDGEFDIRSGRSDSVTGAIQMAIRASALSHRLQK